MVLLVELMVAPMTMELLPNWKKAALEMDLEGRRQGIEHPTRSLGWDWLGTHRSPIHQSMYKQWQPW